MIHVREEISSYLDEYFEETGLPAPLNIEAYIVEQTNLVLTKMYADLDSSPDEEDPETTEGDYYRQSIAEYGNVYSDYPI